jgi:hypothetical protein
MKRCGQCHGKLGLRVRFISCATAASTLAFAFVRLIAKGFCELERYEARAKHCWYTFLASERPHTPSRDGLRA